MCLFLIYCFTRCHIFTFLLCGSLTEPCGKMTMQTELFCCRAGCTGRVFTPVPSGICFLAAGCISQTPANTRQYTGDCSHGHTVDPAIVLKRTPISLLLCHVVKNKTQCLCLCSCVLNSLLSSID